MISNRCARKSLVTNCNSIISENYLRFLVDSNVIFYKDTYLHEMNEWNNVHLARKIVYQAYKNP